MSNRPPFLHLTLLPSTFPPAMLSMRWHTKTPIESACFELQHSFWAWKKHAMHSPKMKHDFRCWYVNCRNVKGTFFLSQYSFLSKYCARPYMNILHRRKSLKPPLSARSIHVFVHLPQKPSNPSYLTWFMCTTLLECSLLALATCAHLEVPGGTPW